MNLQLLIIDFEFTMPQQETGRRGYFPEIIEAGVISIRENEVFETFNSFVKPEHNSVLSERCKNFLGISQQDVDDGISFPTLLKKLNQLDLSGNTTIITWGNMDMQVLRSNCLFWNLPFPFDPVDELDLSLEHKRFYGEKNQTGLVKALREYGKTEKGNHHRALDDAFTTYEIYRLMEKDKAHMKDPVPAILGERVDFSKVLERLARWKKEYQSKGG